MYSTTLNMPEEMGKRLENISEKIGRSPTHIILEALNEYLGDLEDICIAQQRLADIRSGSSHVLSSDEVERMLNVEN